MSFEVVKSTATQ